MTEIVKFSPIGAEDINFGTGTFDVELQDSSVVAFSRVNIDHLEPNLTEGSVIFKGSGTGLSQDNAGLFYDDANNRLRVGEITGGAASGGDITIDSTAHATKGDVFLNPTGGNVGIGSVTPGELLHVAAATEAAIRVENTSAGVSGDIQIEFSKAGTLKWAAGIDDSDSDAFKISEDGVLGTNDRIVIKSDSVGINENTPLGNLHIKSTDAGAVTVSGNADELVVESSTNAGISIVSSTSGLGSVDFTDSDAFSGRLIYNHATDTMSITAASNQRLTVGEAMFFNDTANSESTAGLTVNQLGNNDEALSVKSSDVAHGVTGITETDTYALMMKQNSSLGGLMVKGLSEDEVGIQLDGIATTVDTGKTTAADAPIVLNALLKSGTGAIAVSADGNLLAVGSNNLTHFIVDVEGDLHVDGSGTLTTFDSHDDIQLIESVKSIMSPDFRKTLGPWVKGNLEVLKAGGVISGDDDRPFISYKGLSGLLIDALRQLDSRLKAAGI